MSKFERLRVILKVECQTEAYLKDIGMTGLTSAWAMAIDGVLSEGYGHEGPGVCVGDGQTETEGVPSQGGRGDALLRRTLSHLTLSS